MKDIVFSLLFFINGFLSFSFASEKSIVNSSVFSKEYKTLDFNNVYISQDTTIKVTTNSPIYGFFIEGEGRFNRNNGLIRIILVDSNEREYLAYETYPLLEDGSDFMFTNAAQETSNLNGITPKEIQIQAFNASIVLQTVSFQKEPIVTKQRQQAKTLSNESETIKKLNENLQKRNQLWRAGETSLSKLSYEEKKLIFGGTIPNLGGFEYYKSGIFVVPDYEYTPQKTSKLIPQWDWRYRHGKNWLSPVKNQGNCGSCWAFATVGTVEAYTNLYFNRLLNLDLSEQNLVSCDLNNHGCSGGQIIMALYFASSTGIVNEQCFPYIDQPGSCVDKCSTPKELLNIEQYYVCQTSTEDDLKKELFRAPIDMSIKEIQHAVVLVGYKVLQAGDSICVGDLRDNNWVVLDANNPLIGSTAWIIKNSYGTDFGENGYANIIANWDYLHNRTCGIWGKISSLQYTDNDILVEDKDKDGYFFWGIGERPKNLPAWVPEQPDGDDSDPNAGVLDEFGYLQNLHPDNLDPIYIQSRVEWNDSFKMIYPYVFIKQGGELIISGTTRLNRNSKIFVQSGGKLTINGGTIEQADIKISKGGTCVLTNKGVLQLGVEDSFQPEPGSTLRIENGSIKKQ